MKIAVLYSGHPRFFGITLQNHLNRFKNDEHFTFDLYAHIWKTEKEIYKYGYSINYDIKFIENILKKHFKSYIYENYNLQRPFYTINECMNLIKDYQIQNNMKYDYIIRIRPDLFLFSDIKSIIINHEFYIKNTKHKNFLDDQFFIMNNSTFNKMCNIYDHSIKNVYKKTHDIMYEFTKLNNINVTFCSLQYTLIRKFLLTEMLLENNLIYDEEFILYNMKKYNERFAIHIENYKRKPPDEEWSDMGQIYTIDL